MSVHDWIASGVNIAVAGAAIYALVIAKRQIAVSREVSAVEAYEEYHKLCLDYPEFSNGADPAKLTAKDLERYVSFVLYVLMVGERIFLLFPNAQEWVSAIEDDIRIHRRLIESRHFSKYLAEPWGISVLFNRVLSETVLENQSKAFSK